MLKIAAVRYLWLRILKYAQQVKNTGKNMLPTICYLQPYSKKIEH